MNVQGKIWFTANTREDGHPMVRYLFDLMAGADLPFSKDKSIVVQTTLPGDPDNPYFRLLNGVDPSYNPPHFKTHYR